VARTLILQMLLLVGVFVVVTAIASVAGATNLGTAATFGQVAFAIALVAVMLGDDRRPGRGRGKH